MKPATEDSHNSLRKVAVFGGGVTAWTAAATLASQFKHLDVTLVDCGDKDNLSPVENCWPSVLQIHQWLNISERQLLTDTQSVFCLGTQYCRWPTSIGKKEERQWRSGGFFAPFSPFGFNLKGVDFFSYLIRANQRHLKVEQTPDSYSLSSMAAISGKFRPPSQNKASVFSTLEYAYNLDIAAYQQLLQTRAKELGVKVICANIRRVNNFETASEIGSVSCNEAVTARQVEIEADLFVDCTGQKAALAEVKGRKCDGQHNRQLQFKYTVRNETPPPPYHSLTAQELGWSSQVSSSDILSGCYVVNRIEPSQQWNNDNLCQQVANELEARLGKPLLSLELTEVSLQRNTSWIGNCVVMGEGCGVVEPFYVPKLHLFHRALVRLVESFPAHLHAIPACAAHYNRLALREMGFVEEFNLLHRMSLEDKLLNDPWQHQPLEKQPHLCAKERLNYRLALFQATGKHAFYEGDMITSHAWKGFLINIGFWPKHYDPLSDMVNPLWITQQLNKIHTTFKQAASSMPSHEEYVASLHRGKANASNR